MKSNMINDNEISEIICYDQAVSLLFFHCVLRIMNKAKLVLHLILPTALTIGGGP